MTMIAVERIKLATTRSPWWCAAGAFALSVGFAAILLTFDNATLGDPTLATTQAAYPFGMTLVMVMAALAVTTEYRFGTLRTTFMAAPKRSSALVAKAVVVGAIGGTIGLAAGFASWGIGLLVAPQADLALDSISDWRQVAGVSLVYAFAAVMAVAVGTLVRHTAGAITLLLVWTLVLEKLIGSVPGFGEEVSPWLPVNSTYEFLTQGAPSLQGTAAPYVEATSGTWFGIIYFAAIATVLMFVAIKVAQRRDA